VGWDPYGETSVAVIDRDGRGFDFLRSLGLELGLWRVRSGDELAETPGAVAVLAAYTPAELAAGNALMRGRPTIALGIGLGPREASRALLLGAIGYVHDGLDPGICQRQIADSFARLRGRPGGRR
jgi:hypothetical protein